MKQGSKENKEDFRITQEIQQFLQPLEKGNY